MGLYLVAGASAAADVTIALVAAVFIGAIAASFLRVPRIAGYLVAGALIGPAGVGWVDDPDRARFAAELGVALLLFVVGLELSLRELASNLRLALLIAIGEVMAAGAFVFIGARLFDVPGAGAFVLAGASGLSSTAVALALLGPLGERGRAIAPVLVAVLIVQDIVAIVLIGIVPTLEGGSPGQVSAASVRLLVSLAILVPALPILAISARFAFSWVATRIDRELFLIVVVASIGGLVALALQLDLSVALGAFVAGLIISQTGYAEQALRETIALRDILAAAFFVSAGLLFDPDALRGEPGLFAVLLVAAIPLKFAVVAGLARFSGLAWRPALLLALLLANAGEFSFVVTDVAPAAVLNADAREVMLMAVVGSLLVTSLAVGWRGRAPLSEAVQPSAARGTVVVAGYGRLGRVASAELRRRGIALTVVERDGEFAALARADGFPALWGDISQRAIARRLGRPSAVLVTPSGATGATIVEEVAGIFPGARVVTPSAPEDLLPRLGLDLTIVDVDAAAADSVANAVERSLASPPEPFTVRSRHGKVRYAPRPAARRARSLWARVADAFERAPAAPGGACPACGGSGRRFAGAMFVRCGVCGGDGRRGSP
ncbi:MAG: cation:proton antiporter [Tepidiformaceae bacterium]